MQQQLQMIAVQKQQLQVDKKEAEEAGEQVKGSKGDVYKAVGPILMKSDKATVSKGLKETVSSAEERVSILEKQEKKIALKVQELQKELQTELQGLQGA